MTEQTTVKQGLSSAVRQNPALLPCVQEAAKFLQKAASNTAIPTQIAWSEVDPSNEPSVLVEISDELGRVSKRFTRRQLSDKNWLEYEMLRLWDEVLSVRSKEMLKRLRSMDSENV